MRTKERHSFEYRKSVRIDLTRVTQTRCLGEASISYECEIEWCGQPTDADYDMRLFLSKIADVLGLLSRM